MSPCPKTISSFQKHGSIRISENPYAKISCSYANDDEDRSDCSMEMQDNISAVKIVAPNDKIKRRMTHLMPSGKPIFAPVSAVKKQSVLLDCDFRPVAAKKQSCINMI